MNKIEKRNMKLINKWLTAWTLPGGSHQKMLDCYSYSDNLEVFAPIQEYYVVKKGGNREFWDQGEGKIESQTKSRSMELSNIIASDNKVAIEGMINTESNEGIKNQWNFSVFFIIDDESGLIISDHSYMPDTPGMKVLKPR
ncbi:hypothetical protein N9B91_00945 [Gammaproteobacteria bacterium]|jgi:hypothetical protein|nr:hypothetical protein [Gammaproteobacteria bacterium]MDA9784936.1 hypothetical protein [Gammaproteobacteria bacterium]